MRNDPLPSRNVCDVSLLVATFCGDSWFSGLLDPLSPHSRRQRRRSTERAATLGLVLSLINRVTQTSSRNFVRSGNGSPLRLSFQRKLSRDHFDFAPKILNATHNSPERFCHRRDRIYGKSFMEISKSVSLLLFFSSSFNPAVIYAIFVRRFQLIAVF